MGVTHCLFHSINYVVRAKWQHAQRVVPQKMATGGDENKKNNSNNKKTRERGDCPAWNFDWQHFCVSTFLAASCMCVRCAGVCVCVCAFRNLQ